MENKKIRVYNFIDDGNDEFETEFESESKDEDENLIFEVFKSELTFIINHKITDDDDEYDFYGYKNEIYYGKYDKYDDEIFLTNYEFFKNPKYMEIYNACKAYQRKQKIKNILEDLEK